MGEENGLRVLIDKTKEFKEQTEMLRSKVVLVGIPESENRRENGALIGNAGIGYVQENGQEDLGIPPRPFLVPGVRSAKAAITEALKVGAYNVYTHGAHTIKESYTKAGIIAQIAVKKFIIAGDGFKKLADATLAARKRAGFKGTKPLIWTGQMLNSINFVVRGKNGGD